MIATFVVGGLVSLLVFARLATLPDTCSFDVSTPTEVSRGREFTRLAFDCYPAFGSDPTATATFHYELVSWYLLFLAAAILLILLISAYRRRSALWHAPHEHDAWLRLLASFARPVTVVGIAMIVAVSASVALLPLACHAAGASVPSGAGSASLEWTGGQNTLVPSPDCRVLDGGEWIASFPYSLDTPVFIALIGVFLVIRGGRASALVRRHRQVPPSLR